MAFSPVSREKKTLTIRTDVAKNAPPSASWNTTKTVSSPKAVDSPDPKPQLGDAIEAWEKLSRLQHPGFLIIRWNSKGEKLLLHRASWLEHGDEAGKTESAHTRCMEACQEYLMSGPAGVPFWAGYSLDAVHEDRPGHRDQEQKLICFLITPIVSDMVNTNTDVVPSTPQNGLDSRAAKARKISNQLVGNQLRPSEVMFGQTCGALRELTKRLKNRIKSAVFDSPDLQMKCALYLEVSSCEKMQEDSYMDLVHKMSGSPNSFVSFGGGHCETRKSSSSKKNLNSSQDEVLRAKEEEERRVSKIYALGMEEEERDKRMSSHAEVDRSSTIMRRMHQSWVLKEMNKEWGRRVLFEKKGPSESTKARNAEIKKMLCSDEAHKKFERMTQVHAKQHANDQKDSVLNELILKTKLIDGIEANASKQRSSLILRLYDAEKVRRSASAEAMEEEYRRCALAKAVSHGIHYELSEVAGALGQSAAQAHVLGKLEEEKERRMTEAPLPDEKHVKLTKKLGNELKRKIKKSGEDHEIWEI